MYRPEVTLPELLDSREKRAAEQERLIEAYRCPLICFTVVMPGSEKLNRESRQIFESGCLAIEDALEGKPVLYLRELIKRTGCEGYFAVDCDETELKKAMIEIEEYHPYGRLFDIDVIGRSFRPISRKELGHPERECLVCGEVSAVCVKSRRHSTEEVLTAIRKILNTERKY